MNAPAPRVVKSPLRASRKQEAHASHPQAPQKDALKELGQDGDDLGHRRARGHKNWVKTVTTSAIDVPEGTMNKPARQVADVLLRKNKGKTPGSINRYIQFYLNRGGTGISQTRKKTLTRAMALIRDSK